MHVGENCCLLSAVPREVVRDPEAAHDLPEGPVRYGHVQREEPRGHRGPQQRAAVSSVTVAGVSPLLFLSFVELFLWENDHRATGLLQAPRSVTIQLLKDILFKMDDLDLVLTLILATTEAFLPSWALLR